MLLALGCGVADPAPVPEAFTRRDPILSATADTTTNSVFLLDLRFDNGHAAVCSATLISPRVLATAAHCLDPSREGAASMTVKATNKADDSNLKASDFIAGTMLARHPSYPAVMGADLGLILLASAPVGVTPVQLQRTPPGSWVGQPLRVVGYGRTAAGTSDSGTRRTGNVTVSSANADSLEFGTAGATGICSGDSGGPGFFSQGGVERIAGVHSYVISAACGIGDDVRIDTHLAFIDAFIAANDAATCGADGRCLAGCSPADVDCPKCTSDGRCDANCATPDPDCPKCVADAFCDTTCASDPDCAPICTTDGVCNKACASDPDCTAACATEDSVCSSDCPVVDPDCLTDGDVCTDPNQCATRVCLADARGYSTCSRTCDSSARCQRQMICEGGFCRVPVSDALDGGNGTSVRGGCSVAPGVLGLLAVAWLLARRRTTS